jgi:hypothetical protein
MKTTLAITLALLAAAPAIAADAPTTQPAAKSETPSTQPADTQPAKPKPKLNDPAPRKNVPIVIKEAKDVWKLLPEDLRPGKDGKVSDELAKKIEAWAKEGKFDQKVQFATMEGDKKEGVPGFDATWKSRDGTTPKVSIKAQVRDEKEIAKIKNTKHNDGENPLPEYLGVLAEFKVSGNGESIKFSILLKDVKVLKVSIVPLVTG